MEKVYLKPDGSIVSKDNTILLPENEGRASLYVDMTKWGNALVYTNQSDVYDISSIFVNEEDIELNVALKSENRVDTDVNTNISVGSSLPVGSIIESIDARLSDKNSDFLECDGREITTEDYPLMQGLLTKKSDILVLAEKYLATASDMYSGTYEPWLTFDGSFTTGYNRGWLRGATSVGENIYIQRKFLEPVKWERVCINQGGSDAVYPKEILFKGSHDGVNWFTLGKGSFPKVQYTNMYYEFEENLDEYTYYRACIMSHHAGGSWGTGINEMWFDTSSTKVGHLPNISKYSDGTNEIHTYIKVK